MIYYIMDSHSIHEAFQSTQSLGIFNPRLNKLFLGFYCDYIYDIFCKTNQFYAIL